MTQLGADVDELERLGHIISRAADQLERSRATLTAALRGVQWWGPDSERFRARWLSADSPRLTTAVAALRDQKRHLEREAADQRRASASGGDGGPGNDGQSRIMTFNIGRGAGDLPGGLDDGEDAPGATFGQLDLVAAEIAAGDADVVSLQEVHRDDLPRLIELLADRHGLDYHVEFQEALSDTDERLAENIDPTRRNPFGNAVLSLAPLTSLDGGALPFDGREPRAFQVEQTTIEGREVTVVNTHLGLVDDERPAALEWLLGEVDTPQDRQTWEIFDVATEQDGPVIVTGDFNQQPGELAENARQFDLDGRVDVANDRGRATNQGGSTIDYVLVSPDIEPVDTDIEPGVSDHHSVTVEVELPD